MLRLLPAFALCAWAVTVTGMTPAAPVPHIPDPSDEGERALVRGKRFLARGRVDLFVAATAAWPLKPDDPNMWEPAAELDRTLVERSKLERDCKPQDTPSSYKDFATFLDRARPEFKRSTETYFRPDPMNRIPPLTLFRELVQAPGVVDPRGIFGCLILSQGDVQVGTGISSSVVFANGSVTAQNLLQSVVVVCDGDVTVIGRLICRSVVVARGNITAPSAGTGVLIAGGKVEVENKKALTDKNPDCIRENQTEMFGLTFFELSQLGLKVKAAGNGLTVDAVVPRSAAAKAGLQPGDVILEAKDKKPADAEGLRRLLRDALALGEPTVKVKRGAETHLLKLALPD
jgi:hypothetical protein